MSENRIVSALLPDVLDEYQDYITDENLIEILAMSATEIREMRKVLNVARSHLSVIGVVNGQTEAHRRVMGRIEEALNIERIRVKLKIKASV